MIIVLLLSSMFLVFYIYYRKINKVSLAYIAEEAETIEALEENVTKMFNVLLGQNIKDMNLSRQEYDRREKEKNELRKALRESAIGNSTYKQYIVRFICDQMKLGRLGVSEKNINRFIHFDNRGVLSGRDKWEILVYIYHYKFLYGKDSIKQLILDYGLYLPVKSDDNRDTFEITKEKIDEIYDIEITEHLSYEDKLNILARRVFADSKGFGAVDLLFDYSIDEIEGGVSGIPVDLFIRHKNEKLYEYSYKAIWIMFSGINIKLSFMGFESQKELIRVCQNIYKYNAPYALSKQNGYVVSTMKDGSRAVVVRPPFSDSWAFLVRKFDSVVIKAPEELIKDENSYIPINMMKWLIRGCLTIAITGQQGTGKTTWLKSIIRFIPESLNLRIQEMTFEMALRAEYPKRNIMTFQETESIMAQEGLNLQKKTNGAVNILGEIATAEAATFVIQTSMVASRMTMFTHHAKTTRDLIISFRNNFLETSGYSNDIVVEEMVAETINIDCHMEVRNGRRYIERITEIIPIRDRRYPSEIYTELSIDEKLKLDQMEYMHRTTDRVLFTAVNIVEFRDGRYVFVNMPSDKTLQKLEGMLNIDERECFYEEIEAMKRISKEYHFERSVSDNGFA